MAKHVLAFINGRRNLTTEMKREFDFTSQKKKNLFCIKTES